MTDLVFIVCRWVCMLWKDAFECAFVLKQMGEKMNENGGPFGLYQLLEMNPNGLSLQDGEVEGHPEWMPWRIFGSLISSQFPCCWITLKRHLLVADAYHHAELKQRTYVEEKNHHVCVPFHWGRTLKSMPVSKGECQPKDRRQFQEETFESTEQH